MLETSLEDRRREQRLVTSRAIVAGAFVILGLAAIVVRLLHLEVDAA